MNELLRNTMLSLPYLPSLIGLHHTSFHDMWLFVIVVIIVLILFLIYVHHEVRKERKHEGFTITPAPKLKQNPEADALIKKYRSASQDLLTQIKKAKEGHS